MDKALRNTLRSMVTQARKILEAAIQEQLQGVFGIHTNGNIEPATAMTHLSSEDQHYREQILVHLQHIHASGFSMKDAIEQLVREVSYTHLNRLCAYKMMEKRKIIQETVSRGLKSRGVLLYVDEHSEEEQLWISGKQDVAYRHFLEWRGEKLSEEIGVLFSSSDPANRLFPPQRVIDELLTLINSDELQTVWSEDETIGWVYQYFTPKELRDKARNESQAPRNSYELAFRNQFYTPSYVVQFLTDNTLGRTWYEMCQGKTQLIEQCTYMVRRPDEVFFAKADSPKVEEAQRWLQGEDVPEPELWPLAHTVNAYIRVGSFGEGGNEWVEKQLPRLTKDGARELKTQELLDLLFLFCRKERFCEGTLESLANELEFIMAVLRERVHSTSKENRSQEELLRAPFFISYRPMKDPREIKILDPACGSGHFLLYSFDLLETIYLEAYEDDKLGSALQRDYPTLDDLKRAIPGLILALNLHGIDIDLRATQIASLALWLRCQKAYQESNVKSNERPKITRSNIVCAEPMPGEKDLLEEFTATLQPKILGTLVETIFDKMRLASEAGSLLKIEVEIKEAILEAKQRWLMRPKAEQLALWYGSEKADKKRIFNDDAEITNTAFWNEAEARVIEALHTYAKSISNGKGLARQLFADDTVQGFAFIDICQKLFDVVLMNPPFGSPSLPAENYLHHTYPHSAYEIYGQFLFRVISWCSGYVGAITSRGFLYLANFLSIRKSIYPTLSIFLDLGSGILDTAFVEVCAYILDSKNNYNNVICLDARSISLSSEGIGNTSGKLFKDVVKYDFNLKHLSALPSMPFCYDTPPEILQMFGLNWTIESATHGIARVGLATGDNERFVRCYWEVPKQSISNRWQWHAKGGEYLPFKPDVHLVVDWADDGHIIEESFAGARIKKLDVYFRPGVTYSLRSLKGLSFRVLPSGCICSNKGPVIISPGHEYAILALANSSAFKYLAEIQTSASAYEVGIIQKTPIPNTFIEVESMLEVYGRNVVTEYMSLVYCDETDVHFQWPWFWKDAVSITNMAELLENHLKVSQKNSRLFLEEIDREMILAYNWPSEHRLFNEYDKMLEEFIINNPLEHICRLMLSVCVGCTFGSFSRSIINHSAIQVDPYASLPQGQLISSILFSSSLTEEAYQENGIAVDDPEHLEDIIRCVRDVLKVIWQERADIIEQEACQILGVKELRDYFRRSGNGGFWTDHIQRYSKSRRKAPIYWLLQSSKKNYAVWLYYHRLNKDTLFRVLNTVVEPKLRLEETQLEQLRTQLMRVGAAGREAKQLERQLERQENFISEIEDFRDKLRRAADLNLEPDLNDGVVLNIAPLWELVPWNEAKRYWQELKAGKYEWSTIGKQLREKGIIND